MSHSIDYNDIEERIKILFSATDNYLNYVTIKRPEMVKQEVVKTDVGTTFKITIGGTELTKQELINIKNQIYQMIDNLANLKDNTINALKLEGLSSHQANDLVNTYINNFIELSIITDLDNQNKHGYPLTRSNRSNLSPRIKNIRNEMIAPLHFSYMDIFSEGKIVFEADIIDDNDRVVFTLRKLIDKSIQLWENFYLKYLNSKSGEIKERRLRIETWNQKYYEFSQLEKFTRNEIIKKEHWKFINPDTLNVGYLLKAFNKNSGKETYGGISTSEVYTQESKRYLTIWNVFLIGENNTVNIDEFNWLLFIPDDILILRKVQEYYYQLNNMKQFANRGRFGDQ